MGKLREILKSAWLANYWDARSIENELEAEIIAFDELSITLTITVCVPLSRFVCETLFPAPLDSSLPFIVIKILCPERREGSKLTDIVTFPSLLLIADPSAGLDTNIFL